MDVSRPRHVRRPTSTTQQTPLPTVWLELEGSVQGRLEFELDIERCPKASHNFTLLAKADPVELEQCQAALGPAVTLPPPLVGSLVGPIHSHEVVEFGTSSTSSCWGTFFNDEGLDEHNTRDKNIVAKRFTNANFGALSMSNAGPNTNASRFFITLSENGEQRGLDQYHVCFGRLISGAALLGAISALPVDAKRGHMPKLPVRIVAAGVVQPKIPQLNVVKGGRRGRDETDSVPQSDDADYGAAFKRRRLESSSPAASTPALDPRFAGVLPAPAVGGVAGLPSAREVCEAQQRVFEFDLLQVKELQKQKKDKSSTARSRAGKALKPNKRMSYK